MVDETHPVVDLVTEGSLNASKLYHFAQSHKLLDFLEPNLLNKIEVEGEIEEQFPREEDDEDGTRILINFQNIRQKSTLYKFVDKERLERIFPIDNFLNGFMNATSQDSLGNDLQQTNNVLLLALSISVSNAIGLTPCSQKDKILSVLTIQSILSTVFSDPLDIMIVVQEQPLKEGQEQTDSSLVALWVIKKRPTV